MCTSWRQSGEDEFTVYERWAQQQSEAGGSPPVCECVQNHFQIVVAVENTQLRGCRRAPHVPLK